MQSTRLSIRRSGDLGIAGYIRLQLFENPMLACMNHLGRNVQFRRDLLHAASLDEPKLKYAAIRRRQVFAELVDDAIQHSPLPSPFINGRWIGLAVVGFMSGADPIVQAFRRMPRLL